MNQLGIIDFDNLTSEQIAKLKPRYAVRAVVFDNEGKVAVIHARRDDYHKLPGGGIEKDEDIAAALQRECQEEIGCNIIVDKEIGSVLEYRGGLKQESSAYLARVNGIKGQPHFTAEETEYDFEIVWVGIDEGIGLFEAEHPADYFGKYMSARDLIFLREARRVLVEQKK